MNLKNGYVQAPAAGQTPYCKQTAKTLGRPAQGLQKKNEMTEMNDDAIKKIVQVTI